MPPPPGLDWFVRTIGIPASGVLGAGLLALSFLMQARDPEHSPWRALRIGALNAVIITLALLVWEASRFVSMQKSAVGLTLGNYLQPLMKLATAMFLCQAVEASRSRISPRLLSATRWAVWSMFFSVVFYFLKSIYLRLSVLTPTPFGAGFLISHRLESLISLFSYSLLAVAAWLWREEAVRRAPLDREFLKEPSAKP